MATKFSNLDLDGIDEDETVDEPGGQTGSKPLRKVDGKWTSIDSDRETGQQPDGTARLQPQAVAGFLASPTKYAVDTLIRPALRQLSTGLEDGTSHVQYWKVYTVATAVQRRHTRLSKARNRDLSLESELQHQWTTLEQQRAHLEQSTRAFMDNLNSAKDKGSFKKSTAKLNTLCARLQTDQATVTEQAAKTQRLEADRSVHSEHLQRLEAALNSAVLALILLLNANSLVSADEDFSPEPFETSVGSVNSASEASVELHPMLRLYYDRAGDVQVMRERLLEVAYKHSEEKGRREFLGDQDAILDTTDEEFEKSYAIDLEAAERSLSHALEARRVAEQSCFEQGLAIPHANQSQSYVDAESEETHVPYDRTSLSPLNSLPSSIDYHLEVDYHVPRTIVTGPMRGDGTPGPSVRVEKLPAADRIMQWILHVEEGVEPVIDGDLPLQPENLGLDETCSSLVEPSPSLPTLEHVSDPDLDTSEKSALPTGEPVKGLGLGTPALDMNFSKHGIPQVPSASTSSGAPMSKIEPDSGPSKLHEDSTASPQLELPWQSQKEEIRGYQSVSPDEQSSHNDDGVEELSAMSAPSTLSPVSLSLHHGWAACWHPGNKAADRCHFQIGTIFQADIAQLHAKTDHTDSGLIRLSKRRYTTVGFFVVIERHLRDFKALAFTSEHHQSRKSLGQADFKNDRSLYLDCTTLRVEAINSIYHGRLTETAVIDTQHATTCVSPLRDDTLIDLKNPIYPLEYNCRRVQHCGKVNEASLPKLLHCWQLVQAVQRRPSL